MKFTLVFNDTDQQFELTGVSPHEKCFFAMSYKGNIKGNINHVEIFPMREIKNRTVKRLFRHKIHQTLPPLIHGKDYFFLTHYPALGWHWEKATCDLTYRQGIPYFVRQLSPIVRQYTPILQPTGYTLTYKAA